jgi:hypothetical protein
MISKAVAPRCRVKDAKEREHLPSPEGDRVDVLAWEPPVRETVMLLA